MVYDLHDRRLITLPTQESGSHYVWNNRNQLIASCIINGIKIKVEHAIGGVKRYRIVKERFRCRKFGFEDMVILIAYGLHNFRICHKMNHITN